MTRTANRMISSSARRFGSSANRDLVGLVAAAPTRARLQAIAATVVAVAAIALASAPASYGATTAYRGAFKCASDGQPLAGARVELWQTHVRWLPEVPPNFRHRNTMRANENGAWGFTVGGDESNWRIRLVLVGEHARVQDWPWPWNWFTDTLRSQNNVPLRDFGTQVVSGYQCGLYTGFSQAGREYQRDVGSPPPQGVTVVRAGAPTAGVPFTLYDEVWWPSGKPAIQDGISVPKHEFAHVVRHLFDGSPGHFFGDVAYYWYLRNHSASSCEATNSGFAFNEGWAEYWSGQVFNRCESNPNTGTIERNVAAMLKELQDSCQLTRGRMVAVLRDNPERIHSIDEFAKALNCTPPRPIKKLGRTKPRKPLGALLKERRALLGEGRRLVSALGRSVTRLGRETAGARRLARRAVPCPRRPCEALLERRLRPVLLGGQLAQARLVKKQFAFLADRRAMRRLGRAPLRRQLRRIEVRRKAAVAGSARIVVRTLGRMRRLARRLGADRESLRILSQAKVLAARRDADTLAAMAPIRLAPPRTVGPSPSPPTQPSPPSPPPPPPPPPPAPKPDLLIARIFLTSSEGWTWNVVVRNEGAGTAPAAQTGLSRAGGPELLLATPALAPGESVTVQAECPYGSLGNATARADAEGVIAEENEDNNSLSYTGGGTGGRCRYP